MATRERPRSGPVDPRLIVKGDASSISTNGYVALDQAALKRLTGKVKASKGGLRLRGFDMARMRPVQWAWTYRIQIGALSLLMGEEGAGKGTLVAWLTARITRGELPGAYRGSPRPVLIVGDEDDFEQAWLPRLIVAGADLTMVRTLADDEPLDDLRESVAELTASVAAESFGLVVFDQLLDHIDGGRDGSGVYNGKHIRASLAPLKQVSRQCDVAILGLMHPIKGQAKSFRELMAASHQFNAVSRSSLWLVPDPDNDARRVVVAGKPPNHGPEPRSFEFAIGVEEFEYGSEDYSAPVVADHREGNHNRFTLMDAKQAERREATSEAIERRRAARFDTVKERVLELVPAVGEPGISKTRAAELLRGSGIGTDSVKAALVILAREKSVVEIEGPRGHPVYVKAG